MPVWIIRIPRRAAGDENTLSTVGRELRLDERRHCRPVVTSQSVCAHAPPTRAGDNPAGLQPSRRSSGGRRRVAAYYEPMRRWPPILWPVMSFASLLILMGLGPWDPFALVLGVVLAVAVFGASLLLATRRLRGRPRPPGFAWAMGALAAFYAIAAVVAATAGPAYAVVAMLASLIPYSALLLLVATARSKTTEAGGSRQDPSAAAGRDPWPGIGMDDATALGDTPEHSDEERVGSPDRRTKRPGRDR
jgi:hypothetical protein